MPPSRRLALPLALLVLLAACSDASSSPSPSTTATARPSATSTPAASATAGSPPATAAPPSAEPTVPPVGDDPPAVSLEVVAGGLDDPIGVAPVPDGRLLVNERRGRVVLVDPAGGETETALDIDDRVLGEGERGLLGLALHPEFPDQPLAFVHYTDGAGRTVLASFGTASLDPLRFDPGSERVLLRVDQPYANHNGGQVAFGPDGLLYLALGDGGSGGDPQGNGQDPSTLLGAILRIDVGDPGDGARAYGVPAGNPFADGGGAPEVYVYGLRNPWRFSFDRLTGELWIADVGQGAWEEVNRLDPGEAAGVNLGWNVMEGAHCYGADSCETDGLVLPVAEYGHDRGCSVSGGYVYRGSEIDGLGGWYLFGDYCSGLVFGTPSDTDGTDLEPRVLFESGASVSAFGEAADGELYVADIGGGTLSRIVAAP